MNSRCFVIKVNTPGRQGGAALLILMTMILLAASYTLLRKLNAAPPDILRDAESVKILGVAKSALLGYAVSSQLRPGQLPCPDYATDAEGLDGLSDVCVESGGLVTPGRLPWRTLGLENLRDTSGARLWYAPSMEFDGNTPINSDLQASLALDAVTQVAAVIIAPGGAVDGQSRPQTAAALDDRSRYLEDANAITDNSFTTLPAAPNVPFNDQLISIGRDELLRLVEKRIVRELAALLRAAPLISPVAASGDICDNSSGLEQGFLPVSDPVGTCPLVASLPGWFINDNWNQVIWYGVKPACTPPSCFTVASSAPPTNNKQILLIAGGSALTGLPQTRPAVTAGDLLDSTENRNGDDVFEILPLSDASNDQIEVVQ